jgi:hypothetical protein
MTQDKRIFAVGKLYIAPIGVALVVGDPATEAYHTCDTQSFSLNISFQKSDLMQSPQCSMFAVARAYYGGKVEVSTDVENLSPEIIKTITGATSTVTAGTRKTVIGKNIVVPYYQIMLVGKDETGGDIVIRIPRASGPDVNITTAISAWAKSGYKAEGYPDTATDEVVTVETPEI